MKVSPVCPAPSSVRGRRKGCTTYTGQFNFYRSQSMQEYVDQIDAVFFTYDDLMRTKIQLKGDHKAELNELHAFLHEWDALLELRANATDFQVLEASREPSHTNRILAAMKKDLVPSLRQLSYFLGYGSLPEELKQSTYVGEQGAKHCIQNVKSMTKGLERWRELDLYDYQAPKLTVTPVVQEDLDQLSKETQLEYVHLIEDHRYMMDCGEDFGSWEAKDQAAFVHELGCVEDRWDVLFGRFQLDGILDKRYMDQCNAILEDIGLSEEQYRSILIENRKKVLAGDKAIPSQDLKVKKTMSSRLGNFVKSLTTNKPSIAVTLVQKNKNTGKSTQRRVKA